MQTAFWFTAFFLLTYGSLQVAAFVYCKRWLRAAAALPLLVMVPVIMVGADPRSHGDGSLFGLVIYFPYLPVTIYLAAMLGVGVFAERRKKEEGEVGSAAEVVEPEGTSQTE